MEKEVVIGLIIALVFFSASIGLLARLNFMPDVEIPQPQLPCPDVQVNITEQDFHRYLLTARANCDFNATIRFHPSEELLRDEARILNLVDNMGEPTVLKTQDCDMPFKALILCNGTLFPGDRVRMYSRSGVIIQKLGR